MDRDNRWDRVSIAWEALVNGNGVLCADGPVAAVENALSIRYSPFIFVRGKLRSNHLLTHSRTHQTR